MQSETLAYKMQPAGHEEPPKRRNYAPNKKLEEAFETWLGSILPDENMLPLYNRAEYAVQNIDASVEEAHALLLAYENYPKVDLAGLFVSAIYNKLPEKIINFDIDLDFFLTHTGYNLPLGKTLIATGKNAKWLGEYAKGTILNYSPGLLETGVWSSGLVINYAQSNDPDFTKNSAGVAINLGNIRNFNITGRTGYLLDFSQVDTGDLIERKVMAEDILRDRRSNNYVERNNFIIEHMMTHEHKMIPELWEYLQQLKQLLEPGKDDYKKALAAVETLGQEPAKTIKTTINELFKRRGYDV